jgi:hypothetical protein
MTSIDKFYGSTDLSGQAHIDPVLCEAARQGFERLSEARPVHANSRVRVKLRPVGITNDPSAVGRQKAVFPIFQPRTLVRTDIAECPETRRCVQHKDSIKPFVPRIETSCLAERQFGDSTDPNHPVH